MYCQNNNLTTLDVRGTSLVDAIVVEADYNGVWYYFNASGYMAESEWVDGYWCDSDGSCTYAGVGSWHSDGNGWWYQDSTGWYPSNMWQKIDGCWYYFESTGYMATNKYVDDYWIGANGVCQ